MSEGAFSAVIVDDEPLAIEGVRMVCATTPLVDIVGEAVDGPSALKLIAAASPQAVFLDISMPGMSGLDVASALKSMATPPLVVLVTANDNFATEAFDLAVIDYVLKPLDPPRLMRAIERIAAVVVQQESRSDKSGELWVPYRGSVVRIAIADVLRCEAERDYVRIYDHERSYLLRGTISDLATRLGDRFVRIHRSTVMAADGIASLRHVGGGSWLAVDGKGAEFPIGRTYLAELRAVLL